jgi:hypothetical protein
MYKDLPDDFKSHYYSNLLWETYNYRNVTKLLNKNNNCERSRDNFFIDIYEIRRQPSIFRRYTIIIKVKYDTLTKNYYVDQTRFLHYEDVLKCLWKYT